MKHKNSKHPHAQDQRKLLDWYQQVQRPLPWRSSREPYRIWISEVMLQQTTVQAVLPYYEKFLLRFPTLKDLARAPLENVFEQWAGLGYYTRARNLHKAAQKLNEKFPQTAAELLELPGFGPYTSRAVASLAFGEKVGVLDGNVIRVLSRFKAWDLPWWKEKEKKKLQEYADELAQHENPELINQALMELGATVCTPRNPTCLLCPWRINCEARKENKIQFYPRPKPREEGQIWLWRPRVVEMKNSLALIKNSEAPFLKNQWIFPGEFEQLKSKPKKFDLSHGITKYSIYIQLGAASEKENTKHFRWVEKTELKKLNPSSLLQKVLNSSKLSSWAFVFFASLSLLLSSCSSTPTAAKNSTLGARVETPALEKNDPLVAMGAKPVTFMGNNHSPIFNENGDRLIFVSEKRALHQNSQIYELEFQRQMERRVTFHDGDALDPFYFGDDQLGYSSTTDEIKESLLTREELNGSKNRLEIYTSDLYGSDILRWTHSPGFDGAAVFARTIGSPGGVRELRGARGTRGFSDNSLIFFSQSLNPRGIYRLDKPQGKAHLLLPAPNNETISSLRISADEKFLYWIEKNSVNKTEMLKRSLLSKFKPEILIQSAGEFSGATQGPEDNQWIISERIPGTKDYQLFLIETQNRCRRPLLSVKGSSLLDPTLNRNRPPLLAFTRQTEGKSQIYVMEWPKSLPPCQDSTNQARISL